MNYDVFGLGNALVDALVVVDDGDLVARHGLVRGTMHLVDDDRWRAVYADVPQGKVTVSSGGSCANSMCTLALLGGSATYSGLVGQDRWGDAYDERLADVLGAHYMQRRPARPTGKCLSLVSAVDAERTMLTDLGCAMELTPNELPLDVVAQANWLHVTGYLLTGGTMVDAAREALTLAKSEGVRISFDVADAFVIDNFRDAVNEVIDEFADLVFMNEAEAQALCPGPADEALDTIASRVETVIVKLGAEGSLVRRGGEVIQVEPVTVDAVDTTGAGDAYAGAFLFGLTRGWPLERCGRLASSVAAHTVAQVGSVIRDQDLLNRLVSHTNA